MASSASVDRVSGTLSDQSEAQHRVHANIDLIQWIYYGPLPDNGHGTTGHWLQRCRHLVEGTRQQQQSLYTVQGIGYIVECTVQVAVE